MGYTQFVKDVSKKGWAKDEIGSHVVRNNHISHCEKNGILASLGGPFCTIEGNEIHAIATMGWVNGPDIGGIKLLGGVDSLIQDNCVYDIRGRGIWLEWLGQGSIVRDNLVFDTRSAALYLEVNHGPILVANNILISPLALSNRSRGSAFVHNLFSGRCVLWNTGRLTPYLKPHSTEIAGMHDNYNGDDCYFNNIFAVPTGAGKAVLSAETRPAGRPTGRLAAFQSFFVIFLRSDKSPVPAGRVNFPETVALATLEGSWDVSFDPKWGGPENITFPKLQDWSQQEIEGIRFYSGRATYRKTFDAPQLTGKPVYLDLGTVHEIARVKLNGRKLGGVWCAPWRIDISDALKEKGNQLEIEVASL